MALIRGKPHSLRLLLGLALAALIALALAGREPFLAWLRGPILIGFAGQLTGSYSDLGVQGRNGAQLAVEHINAAGGIHGRRLELLTRDDQNTPQGALDADQALIDAGVLAIIGHMTSSQSMAALPLVNRTRTVLLSPTTSTPLLSGQDDYFFRISPNFAMVPGFLAEHVRREMDLTRLAVILDPRNDQYSRAWSEHFSRRFEDLGGRLTLTMATEFTDERDFLRIAQALNEQRIEALLIVASARDTADLAQHMAKLSRPVRLLASDWSRTDTLLRHGGRFVEGMTIAVPTPVEDPESQAYITFAEQFSDRFGSQPSFAATRAYDAAMFLAEGLRRCDARREELPEALLSIEDFSALTGALSLDRFGDVRSGAVLMRVSGGRYVRHE